MSRSTLRTRSAAYVLLSLASACAAPVVSGGDAGRADTGSATDGAAGDARGLDGDADGGSRADGAMGTIPRVVSTLPVDHAVDVPVNRNVSAWFSEAMDRASLDPTTFTLTAGVPAVPVVGTVIYAHETAVFRPAARLASDTTFTATIHTGATSAAGVSLSADHVWTFTTGNTTAGELPVDLGTAGDFVVLAKSAISSVPPSAITGDIGVSPAAATFITGFSLTADPTNVFSTSPQVTGRIFAADYAVPTPSNLTTAIGDMELAFTAAAGRAPGVTELGAGNIGGMTLPGDVYQWSTGLLVPTDVYLDGSATDVWIFQIAQDLTVSNGATMHLTGGALPENVFWQVAGLVDIGTTAHCEGVILTQTAVTMHTGSSVRGRVFAQTAVSLESSTLVAP